MNRYYLRFSGFSGDSMLKAFRTFFLLFEMCLIIKRRSRTCSLHVCVCVIYFINVYVYRVSEVMDYWDLLYKEGRHTIINNN